MFNDERIELEMSKLKKIIILLSGVLGAIFLLYKLFCNITRDLDFCLYSTEVIITVLSIGILLGSLLVKAKVKDELFYQRKANYYNIAFKILLYVTFISYALVIPATMVASDNSVLSSNICINMIMISSLFFGYAYLRFKRIYFNYNIIEADSKTYYKNVFKNILKICKFFGIIYLISFIVSLFYIGTYSILTFIIAILLAFITSIFSNSIYYFFISFLERLFFKEEENKKITTPTIILIVMSTIFLFIASVFNLINSSLAIGDFGNSSVSSLTSILSILSSVSKYFTELCRFFSVLGITFLLSDIAKNNNQLLNKFKGLIIAFIIFIIYEVIWARISSVVMIVVGDIYSISSTNINLPMSYSQVLLMLTRIPFAIKFMFYTITSIVVLIKFKKEIANKISVRILFIISILMYIISFLSYLSQKAVLIYMFSIMGPVILVIAFLILIIKGYKNNNKFEQTEDLF